MDGGRDRGKDLRSRSGFWDGVEVGFWYRGRGRGQVSIPRSGLGFRDRDRVRVFGLVGFKIGGQDRVSRHESGSGFGTKVEVEVGF